MKIQCDVCGKDEAALFCTADEAAICRGCDHRVHHANKLASQHQRFSLLSPSAKDFPLCDICQEKRAFLFCQQDRAILCWDCDVPIHTANEHTQKHNRFLLTGVKLSATSTLYSAAAGPPASLGFDTVPEFPAEALSVKKPPASASSSQQLPPPTKSARTAASVTSPAAIPKVGNSNNPGSVAASQGNGSTSSISEYLIEMLPGWHFEDFLDSCSASFGFCKSGDDRDGLLPLVDGDDKTTSSSMSSESLGIWVPQAPNPLPHAAPTIDQFAAQINGFKDAAVAMKHNSNNSNYRWSDDSFAVPQIRPLSSGWKRSRQHFY
ncbi:B-box zinc finger protein 21-like [Punica granatum]|uniref:B-box zinc finger protein 21-like n=1 Tax=Punica granatum TaxID=22663 RepID=A0A6P8ED85_PUNGR|nr:B-box zinc finger protein 21-like [Punica granatum]